MNINLPLNNSIQIDSFAFYNTGYYNNELNWENNVLYINNHLIQANSDIAGTYILKEETKSIANSAFLNCSNLQKIYIGKNIIEIPSEVFSGCTSLTDIYIDAPEDSISGGL